MQCLVAAEDYDNYDIPDEFAIVVMDQEHPAAAADLICARVATPMQRRKRKLKGMQQTVRKQSRMIEKLQDDVAFAQQVIVAVHEHSRHWLPHAGLHLAIPQNIGHVSCGGMAATNACSGQTVVRWEQKMGASIIACAMRFHSRMEVNVRNAAGIDSASLYTFSKVMQPRHTLDITTKCKCCLWSQHTF